MIKSRVLVLAGLGALFSMPLMAEQEIPQSVQQPALEAIPAETPVEVPQAPQLGAPPPAQRSVLPESNSELFIRVNIPAFRLTLFQNEKEVTAFAIGVAQRRYPIVSGPRKITQVIWNPPWIPPDSAWVLESRYDVEPGEWVRAGDPRNPLGKIKLPLGSGYLIHQAAHTSDMGSLVSHGCIRMRISDLKELSYKIVQVCAPNFSNEKIEMADKSTTTLVVNLNFPVNVDIVYNTMVVEDGVLRLYPDVYGHGCNTVDNLRQELMTAGIDPAKLDSAMLEGLLARISKRNAFAVNVKDIEDGRALVAGWNEPLNPFSSAKSAPYASALKN